MLFLLLFYLVMFSIAFPLNYVLNILVCLSGCLPVCILACVYTKMGSYLCQVSSPAGKHTLGLGQACRRRWLRGCSWDWYGGQEVGKGLTVQREETRSFHVPQSCMELRRRHGFLRDNCLLLRPPGSLSGDKRSFMLTGVWPAHHSFRSNT